ncbi:hypothetical protein PHLCEN_2v6860 [Hermanssonia centrifuga]|uniref:NAD(P)-binding protein n=1 Tax=Hermanssonia centrifuga TaxID=98765 RepID=A0A2R6NY63_9APHY|nr:hypothetical protein PHLCEN_2v6860 [Hermanssonia centrifuga]
MAPPIGTILRQMFPSEPTWSTNHIPDLSSKVVLVTGGNTVYLGARSQSKAEQAIHDLQQETGKTAIFLQMDLADFDSVKRAAEDFKSRETELHILFLNAGVLGTPIEQVTAQGYDMQFGNNVLGHFLLLKLLYPVLAASTVPSSPSRIIWLASASQYFFQAPMKYDTFKDGPARIKLGIHQHYCQSKFANVLLSFHLARTCHQDNIVSILVDPGNIKSDLNRHTTSFLFKILQWILLFPAKYGPLTQLYAGTSPEAMEYNGKYLRPWARLGEPNSATKDVEEQEKLWAYCEEQVTPWL